MYYITDNPIELIFNRKAISYDRAQCELSLLEKQIKDIDEWFDKYGEHVGNLKFFQMDAKQTQLEKQVKELKYKLGV